MRARYCPINSLGERRREEGCVLGKEGVGDGAGKGVGRLLEGGKVMTRIISMRIVI